MKYFTDEQLARLSEKYSIGDLDFFEEIQNKAEELGVTVNFNRNDIIDFQHLDCTWYYNQGCMASITKEVNGRQYELLLVPSGEINLYGCIDGEEVNFKNGMVNDLISDYGFDDNKLEQFSNSNDENNYLEWDNNNWIAGEVAVNNEICNTFDEILDNNILDNMNDLSGLVDMLDKFIKEYEATLVQRKSEPEIEME